ncbi:hypothetical protein AB0G67_40360 [Streptomyces sp. NPDC021056]|uniref:hypothetical protein n=1 Tax=Streptomyces sp. NPDC021056 TaxID=3155012 RepID=UPI0033F81B2D
MTARELLMSVLRKTDRASLKHRWPDQTIEQIADEILTSRDEETLNSAADDYEAATREQNPGPILGAIRRIRAYKAGAFLRARADAATGYDRSSL